jgi:hypothetical protein
MNQLYFNLIVMKNQLSDLRIIFTVTSLLIVMLVISAVAHPYSSHGGLKRFALAEENATSNQDTSYSALSKSYPTLVVYLRQQGTIKESVANATEKHTASTPTAKKSRKVYYWISYEQLGEDLGPKVNSSHDLHELCIPTTRQYGASRKAKQMKELLPLKINLFNF